jgi:hypothetical protein
MIEIISRNLLGETEEYHALGTLSCKPSTFRKRVKKVKSNAKGKCGENHQNIQ